MLADTANHMVASSLYQDVQQLSFFSLLHEPSGIQDYVPRANSGDTDGVPASASSLATALTVQKATKAFQATANEAVPIRSPASSLAGGMSMISLAPC